MRSTCTWLAFMIIQPPISQPDVGEASVPTDSQRSTLAQPNEENHQRYIREKLLLRQTQLSQAQHMAGMASWEWYFRDTKIQWSPEMYSFWGYEPGEMEVDLDSVAQSTHLDDLPILQGAIAKVLQGEDVEMEYRRFDKLGQEIFIHSIGRIIRNERGEPTGVFGIDINVTKHKQQEQRLVMLNRELEAKNYELEKRNAELKSFSYAASHDLQEPLRKIQTFNSLILEDEADCLSEQAQDYFRRSMAAAGRMQRLIKDLIAYSQTETAIHPTQSVDLALLFEQVKAELHGTIVSTGATIHATPLPTVSVVEFMFRQLLDNLLSNALKYAQPGVPPVIHLTYEQTDNDPEFDALTTAPGESTAPGEVSLRRTGLSDRPGESTGTPERPGQYHKLTIADNGIGFDPAYSHKIFQLFQRLHGRNEYSGTGIGLAICQRIMENHGGVIVADGRIGAGATFTVCWPVRELIE